LRQIFQLFIYACKLDIVEENGFLIVQFFDNNQRNFFSLFFKSAIIFLKQQKNAHIIDKSGAIDVCSRANIVWSKKKIG